LNDSGNYKNIEWVNTSCRGKSCKHECIHDTMNDEKGEYKRCANQDMIENKCDIYVIILIFYYYNYYYCKLFFF